MKHIHLNPKIICSIAVLFLSSNSSAQFDPGALLKQIQKAAEQTQNPTPPKNQQTNPQAEKPLTNNSEIERKATSASATSNPTTSQVSALRSDDFCQRLKTNQPIGQWAKFSLEYPSISSRLSNAEQNNVLYFDPNKFVDSWLKNKMKYDYRKFGGDDVGVWHVNLSTKYAK
jgi:hypothetical protein